MLTREEKMIPSRVKHFIELAPTDFSTRGVSTFVHFDQHSRYEKVSQFATNITHSAMKGSELDLYLKLSGLSEFGLTADGPEVSWWMQNFELYPPQWRMKMLVLCASRQKEFRKNCFRALTWGVRGLAIVTWPLYISVEAGCMVAIRPEGRKLLENLS